MATQVGVATKNATSLVGLPPAGTKAGDVVIFHVASYDNTSVVTVPAGSNIQLASGGRFNHASGGNSALFSATYYLVLTAAAAASYTFTRTGGTAAVDIVTTAWRGLSAANPIDAGPGAMTSAGGFNVNPTGTGLTVSNHASILLWWWYGNDQKLTVTPSGFTSQISGSGSTNNLSAGFMGLYSETHSSGATGSIASTAGVTNDDWIVQLISLVPVTALESTIPTRVPGLPQLTIAQYQAINSQWIYGVPATGGIARAMAISIVGQASVVDAIKVARGLTDAIAGAATMTDAAIVARGLKVAIVGQSTVADNLKVARGLTVAIHGQAALTEALTRAAAIILASHGQASIAESLKVARPLLLAIQGQATMVASLGPGVIALAMAIGGHGTVADALAVLRAEVMAVHGSASMADAFVSHRGLAIAVSALASLHAQVAIARAMGLAINARAVVAAALSASTGPPIVGAQGATTALAGPQGASSALANPQGATNALPSPQGTTWRL